MATSSELNPDAMPYYPLAWRTNDDHRSVFFTFSYGHHIEARRIRDFFCRHYGESCIEKVFIHQGEESPRRPPLYGKIVFSNVECLNAVLQGYEEVEFMVDDISLRCKPYRGKRNAQD